MFYKYYLNCKCAKTLEDASLNFNNKRITNQKKAMVSLYQNTKLHFTLVFKLSSSNCKYPTKVVSNVAKSTQNHRIFHYLKQYKHKFDVSSEGPPSES